MIALARREAAVLPSIERARALLAEARTHDEVRHIRAIAQAVATANSGREIACDAGEIVVLADTRRAELETDERAERIARGKGGHVRGGSGKRPVSPSKSQRVMQTRRAALLVLSESERQAYFRTCRNALKPPTPAGAAAIARLPEADRRAVLDGEQPLAAASLAAALRRAREQITEATHAPVVALADASDWLPSVGPADLLLTDPPYMTDVGDIDEFVRWWLPLALSRLMPTGNAIVFCGAYARELRAYLSLDLGPWRIEIGGWAYGNTFSGALPRNRYVLNWQARLHIRRDESRPIVCPVMLEQLAIQSRPHPARSVNRLHAWQKPDDLAEMFVRHWTAPGDLVIDPFACTGTFVRAAARIGRRGEGCEIDPANHAIAVAAGCIGARDAAE